ncbi:sugar phosphate isomerase/epimerase family protein [Streptomyces spiramyceticus]|uniref:sugar phosphate isomerase/epimerase family protein n=1 Tax=Streptomyces spiramyceticus TaxID=299717 RepID=UPI00237BAAA8|nr:sugar phosphate isomerase/epimerase family protein [Streptomyces spiramyceticus]
MDLDLTQYSRGAFLNILSSDPQEWNTQYTKLQRLDGLQHVELWLEYLPTQDEIKGFRSLLAGMPITVHAPFIGVALAAPWAELRTLSLERCLSARQVASDLDAKVITYHTGTYGVWEKHEDVLEQLVEPLAKIMVGDGPIVAVENMPRRGGASRECLIEVRDLESLSGYLPQLKFTLDIGHCIQNEDDFQHFLQSHHSKIANMHLHDAKRGGKGHLAFGAGDLELPKILDLLNDVGFDGHISLETIGQRDTESSWIEWSRSLRNRQV